ARGDSTAQKAYAVRFETEATRPGYGNMYNKYLIGLYTGILATPSKALTLATRELDNRATPQTWAWYAWSLHMNNQDDSAWQVYQSHISGKPLEATELYYTGKLMKTLGKGYNAGECFKAANENRYDLSPDMIKDLDKNLRE
ncbi:MAG: hypothetical protein JST39_20525, partial [Bacteroidetes bacterium]|nr:hypothetical protein [Bacteroidota bacterium]